MDAERVCAFARQLGCTYSLEEPLSRHLSLGIGGTPEFYVRPRCWEEAAKVLTALWESDLPFKILGSGSNLLATDGRLPFGVVHLARLGGRMRWEGPTVETDADVPMPALASESVRRGLRGLEGMGGIPGTVGGAVVMNAGAFGNDVAAVLSDVALIEPGHGLRWHPAADFTFSYRTSDVKARGIIAGCRMTFAQGDPVSLRLRFDEVKARREATQPWRSATAGSVFKNPPGDSAGRLLEAMGFKGLRKGSAGFSELHANFLVNHGGATFEDAFALCEQARAAAAAKGVTLEYEMEIWT